jgi:NADPH2:quinone reductase
LPYIPGGDAAGIIEMVGSEVSDLKVGQRVYVCGSNSGSYAEYVTSEASMTFPLPEEMTFSQGAAIGVPYFTAYRALLFVAKLKKGENLLVHGVRGYK